MKIHILIALLNLLPFLIIAGESSSDTLQTFDSQDSIIVVANRYQTTLKRVAANYQIINAQEVKQMSVHSALQLVDIQFPSAFVLEKRVIGYGVGSDGAGTLNLRGMGGKPNTGVLVLLNGHPDFMGIFGHPLPDVYGTDNIQQVEILPGASSTVFGSNAMGGVVNIVTKPNFSAPLHISVEGGSFGTYNVGMQLAKQFGDHGGSISVRTKKTDGHAPQTGFKSLNIQTDWSFQLNPVWSISLGARYVPYEFDDPARSNNPGGDDPANLGTYGKIERGAGEIIFENKTDKLNGSTQIYANMGRHRFYDGFESTDHSYGLSTYQYWDYSKTIQIAAGGDLMQYGGQAKNDLTRKPDGSPIVNEERHAFQSFGVYMIGFVSPIQMVQFKGGLRAQYHSVNDFNLAPSAGVSVYPADNWQIFANYQYGFRTPTMMELYLFPSANPNLLPEETNMYEIGLRYQYLLSNSIQLTAYRNNVKNLVQAIPNTPPPPRTTFQNSGNDKQTGVELQFQNRWIRGLSSMLSYGYLEVDYLTYLNPKHQIKYMLLYNLQPLSVSLYGKYIQDIYAANNAQNPMADYNVVNLSAIYDLNIVELNIKLLNILDRQYEYLPGYKAPGFHIFGGLSFNL